MCCYWLSAFSFQSSIIYDYSSDNIILFSLSNFYDIWVLDLTTALLAHILKLILKKKKKQPTNASGLEKNNSKSNFKMENG